MAESEMLTSVKNYRLRLEQSEKGDGIGNEEIGYEKIDEWITGSISEIVQNLRKAPLLLQIYSEKNGTMTKMTTDKAVVDDWPIIKAKWSGGDSALPEGVILVEELKENCDDDDDDSENVHKKNEERGIYRTWGIVIQGKGVLLGPVCYLLKTTTVRSSLELCCTHFCLVRVKNFWESAESQLSNCWLLQ